MLNRHPSKNIFLKGAKLKPLAAFLALSHFAVPAFGCEGPAYTCEGFDEVVVTGIRENQSPNYFPTPGFTPGPSGPSRPLIPQPVQPEKTQTPEETVELPKLDVVAKQASDKYTDPSYLRDLEEMALTRNILRAEIQLRSALAKAEKECRGSVKDSVRSKAELECKDEADALFRNEIKRCDDLAVGGAVTAGIGAVALTGVTLLTGGTATVVFVVGAGAGIGGGGVSAYGANGCKTLAGANLDHNKQTVCPQFGDEYSAQLANQLCDGISK